MRSFLHMPDELVVQVCEEYLADRARGRSAQPGAPARGKATPRSAFDICQELNERWKQAGHPFRISREDLYAVLGEARERGLLALTPNPQDELRNKLIGAYELPPESRERLRVVATESPLPDHVARHAALIIVDLLRELGRKKERVHLGLGAGWTTRVVAYHLARLLRDQRSDLPLLTLHAISSGYAVNHAATAPVVFFGFFEGLIQKLESVGLFGPPWVPVRSYDETIRRAGVKEAFDQKREIDIVVTSLASAADEHGDLLKYVSGGASTETGRLLKKAKWLGDVQHRPFNAHGPIVEERGNRAVTLFELSELAGLARRSDKAVVLVSPPCGGCGYTRARALVPLLRNPALKLWSHLVTDLQTARELLDLSLNPAAERRRASASSLGEGTWGE